MEIPFFVFVRRSLFYAPASPSARRAAARLLSSFLRSATADPLTTPPVRAPPHAHRALRATLKKQKKFAQGTVHDLIQRAKPHGVPEDVAWRLILQSALGLAHIHSLKILHRDVKSENIFLDENFQLKIADFGFAAPIYGKDYETTPQKALKTKLGTVGQMAPELIVLKVDQPELN